MVFRARTSWGGKAGRAFRALGDATLVIGLTTLLAAPALAAPSCVGANERASMDARIVKEYLMVAALNCDARQDYNTFINKFNADLAQHGNVVRRHFKQTHGKAAEREVDRYVTAAANEASIMSNRDRNGFCKRSAAVFRDLNGGRNKRIEPASYGSFVAPSSLRAPICQEAKR